MNDKAAASSGRRARSLSRDDLLVATLERLAGDERWSSAFFAETGQDPAGFRQALSTGSLQNGLLDFLVNNDDLIVAVAQAMGRAPEDVAAAALRATQPGASADYF